MTARRYELTDFEWSIIQPLLPTSRVASLERMIEGAERHLLAAAHRLALGRHPARCMGRSRGGLTTKIHALVDANGLPSGLNVLETPSGVAAIPALHPVDRRMLDDPFRDLRLAMHHALHSRCIFFRIGEMDILALLRGGGQADDHHQFDHRTLRMLTASRVPPGVCLLVDPRA